MNHHTLLSRLPLLAPLCVALACGKTGDPEPLPCSYDAQTVEDGEEVESLDGCMTLACDDGMLVTSEDRRITVPGDLELATQEAVSAQSCLGVVEGTLRISGTAADLTPLRSLYRVGAGLEVVASEAVTLQGFEGMQEVGGAITIADNAALASLAFPAAMSAFGDITIQNNDALTSLVGAEFIGNCTSCIAVSGRPTSVTEQQTLEPFADAGVEPMGGTFYGNILIADNDVLASVQAIGNLYYAWADVRFRSNAALVGLTGLQLMEVRGDLEISDHAAMATADAETFASGISVLGTTTICGNMGGTACP